MTDPTPLPTRHENVVSPFCALGCDDLVVVATGDALEVVEGGDPLSLAGFARPAGDMQPTLDGRPVSLDEAVQAAAALLAGARFPLLAGLETDTDGARAALRLAERTGGTIDHAGGQALLANLRVLQAGGQVMATLSEVRNRADLIVFFGTDAGLMPRFFERIAWPPARLPGTAEGRRLVFIGDGLDLEAARAPDGALPWHVPCAPEALAEAAACLRALATGRLRGDAKAASFDLAALARLAAALKEARYAILAWAPGSLPPADAELIISALSELLKEMNQAGDPDLAQPINRALGLALGGPGNGTGVNQVLAWSWGTPLRSSVATGAPVYDSDGLAGEALLSSGRADALVWIGGLTDRAPPATDVPTVALVPPAVGPLPKARVMIPVGTPGLDHAGTIFRTDGVVALPLRQLRAGGPPSAAHMIDRILAALGPKPDTASMGGAA